MTSYHPRWLATVEPETVKEGEVGITETSEVVRTALLHVFRQRPLRVIETRDYTHYDEESRIYLDSARFDAILDADEAKRLQSELVNIVNGYCQFVWPGFFRLESNYLIELDPDGEVLERYITAVPRMFALHSGDPLLDLLYGDQGAPHGKHSPMPEDVADVLLLPSVRRALAFFGKGVPSWPEMYAVYEIIQEDIGGHIEDEGWSTKADRKLFKRTANHPEAAGLQARHASSAREPPDDPMTLQEGREWIRGVLARWLRSLADEAGDE